MPGSPTSITTEPRPANASSKAARSRSSSRSRPTKTPRARRSSGLAEESECEADFAFGSTASRAASTSEADAGRSAGTFASRRRISASRSGGQCSLCHEGATGGVLMCWLMIAVGSSAWNGGRAGDELVEHRAERVEVCLRRHLAAERLLGRHVRDRADHHPVLRQPRAVERDRESEVADLGDALRGQPDVARLEVAVHDAALVREREPSGHALRDLERPRQRQRTARLLQLALDVAAREQLVDDVRRGRFFADLEDRDDVRVRAEAAHRLRLAHDALAPDLVEAVGLDQRERDIAVEARVVREEDALLAALARGTGAPRSARRRTRLASAARRRRAMSSGGDSRWRARWHRSRSAIARNASASALTASSARTARALLGRPVAQSSR